MIKPEDFAILKDLEEAPDGLYKLQKFAFNEKGAIRLCFRHESGKYVELGINDIQHINNIIPTPQPTKVKIA